MVKRKKVIFLVALLGISTVCAYAQNTYTWNGASGANWSNPGNWNVSPGPGTYPGAAADNAIAIISNGNSPNLNVSPGQTISQLNISSGSSLTAGAARLLRVAGNVTTSGAGTFSSNITLAVSGNGSVIDSTMTLGPLTIAGASGDIISLAQATTLAGTLTINTATLDLGTNALSVGTSSTAGNLVFSGGGKLDFSGATGTNTTYVTVWGTISGTGTIDASGSGSLNCHGNVDLTNITYLPGSTRLWILDPVSLTPGASSFACVRIGSNGLNYYGALTLQGDLHILGIDPTGTTGVFSAGLPGGTPNNPGLGGNSFNLNGHNVTIDDSGTYASDNVVTFVNIPGANLTAPAASTITFTGASTLTSNSANGCVLGSISIGAGGNLTLADALALNGGISVAAGAGTSTFNMAGFTVTVAGNVNLTNLDNFTAPGLYIFDGATTLTVPAGAAYAFTNIQIGDTAGAANGSLTLASAIIVNGTITIGGTTGTTTFNAAAFTVTVAGNVTLTGLDSFTTTGTFIFAGTTTLTVPAGAAYAFTNIQIGDTAGAANGSLTLASAIIVNGTITIGGTTGTTTFNAAAFTVTVAGNVTLTGLDSFTTTGTFIFAGTTTLTVPAGAAYAFTNIQIGATAGAANGSLTLASAIIVNGTITIGGTTGTTTFNAAAFTVTVAGNVTLTGLDSFTTTGTFIFAGTTTLTVPAGAAYAFTNIQIGATAGAANGSLILASAIIVNGTITIGGTTGTTTFNAAAFTVTVAGNVTLTGLDSFTTTGTFIFAGTTTLTVPAGAAYAFTNIQIGATAGAANGSLTLASDIIVNGTITIGGTTGTTTFNAAAFTVTVAGNVTLTGLDSFTTTGTFIFAGTTTLTVPAGAAYAFTNIQIGATAGAANGSLILASAIIVNGTITIGGTTGTTTFNAAAFTVTVAGNVTLTGLDSFTTTGTFIFAGTTTLTVPAGAAYAFTNIQIGATAGAANGSLILASDIIVNGTITIGGTTGTTTFNAAAFTVTVAGNVTLTGLDSFTTTGTFIFAGTTTLTVPAGAAYAFTNIQIGATAGAANGSLILASAIIVNGTITIGGTTGTTTFNAAAFTVTVAGNVTLTGLDSFTTTGTFIFAGTTTLTVPAGAAYAFTNIQIGATAGAANGSLTLASDIIVNGTITIGGTTGTTTFNAAAFTVTVAGNVTLTGLDSFTTTGTFIFAGTTTLTVPAGAAYAFTNIQIGATAGAANGSLILASAIIVNGTITIGGTTGTTTFNAAAFTVTVAGNVTLTGLDSFTTTGTFIFAGTTTLTVPAGAAYAFTNIQIGATAGAANGSLTLASDIIVNGTITIGGTTGTTTFNAAAFTVTVAGNVTLTGLDSFTTTGTFIFAGTTTLTVPAGAAYAFTNIQIGATAGAANGSLILASAIIVNGTITIGGTTGTTTFNAAAFTVTVAGNVTLTGLDSFTTTGTFIFAGTTTLTVPAGAAYAFTNIQIGATAGAANGSLTLASDIIVNGTITIGGTTGTTTFNAAAFTVTVAGNVTLTGLDSFTTTGTFIFAGTTTLTVPAGAAYAFTNIQIGATAGAANGSLTLASDIIVNGTITIGGTTGTTTFNAAAFTVTVAGNVTLTGLDSFTTTGTFIFAGTTTLTVPAGAAYAFTNIQIGATAGAANGSLILASDIIVNGTITIGGTTGTTTFVTSGHTVTAASTVNLTGLDILTIDATSLFIFAGTTTLTVPTGLSLENIQLGASVTPGSVTLGSALNVVLDISISVAGSVLNTNNLDISVGRNWSNSNDASGFTAGNGTVAFAGTATAKISGNTTFYNFTCIPGVGGKTIQFTAGTEQTITNNLTITGTANNLVNLISTSLGFAWTITRTGTGTVTLDFILVSDSNVGAASSDLTALDSRNDGRNDDTVSPRWIFTPRLVIWDGSDSMDWNTGANWDTGYQPNTTDNVRIANAGFQPATLATSTTIVDLTIDTGARVATNNLSLTVTGALSCSGTLDGSASPAAISVTGDTTASGRINLNGGNFSTNNLTVSGVTPNGLVASASETITVGGNIDFSNAGDNFTQATSLIVMTGASDPATINATVEDFFNDLQINKTTGGQRVQLLTNLFLANGAGDLTMSRGTLQLNGFTLRLGTNLSMSSATAATIAIGTGTLDGATNGRSVSISSAAAAITQTTGTMSCAGLSMTNGTYTCTGNSILNSSGSVSVTGGTFSEGTSTLTMSGASTTIRFAQSPLLQPHDLTISAAAPGVSITGENLTVGNNLSVSSGGVFATNNFSLTVNVGLSCSGTLDGSASPAAISVTGDTTASGRINLNGGNFSTNNLTVSGVTPNGLVASASETITVGGNIDFSNAGDNFTQATSLIVMTGASDPATINATGEDFFNDLQINKTTGAQRVQLLTNLFLANGAGDLTMSRGTLQLNGFTLRLGTNLSMSSATAATIAIGTGTLDGATNGRSVSISSAAAAITQTTGTMSCAGLSMTNGTYTCTGNSILNSSGSVSVTGGTFSEGTSTLTMSGASTTIRFAQSPLLQPHDLTISAAAPGVSITGENLTVGNNLSVSSGGVFATGGFSLTVNVGLSCSGTLTGSASPQQISVTGDTTASGRINLNGGNFSTTNLTVSGVPGLVASASETITVGGNIDFSNAGDNFTQATSLIVMTGASDPATINATVEDFFNDLQINKTTGGQRVQLLTNLFLANGAGDLTMSRGTLQLNGFTLRLGTNLSMSSATAATIAIGTGTLDGATNGRTVSISSAAAAITQTTGTMSCAGLSMTNGTYTCTGNSILNSSGSVSVTGGTFSEGTSTLTMSGASTTIRFAQSPLLQPHDLTISAAAPGVSITGENLTVGNNLSVSSGGVFATNNFSLTVTGALSCSGTLTGSASPQQISVTGDTTASGRINLNGGNFSTTNLTVSGVPGLVASASETITVGGNIDFSNAGDNFTQATSLIVMTGASDPATINATVEDFFNDLQINKTTGGQRVQLLTNLFLANGAGDLTMSRGTLQLNGFTLRLGTNLSMSSATAATIAIGTGTLDGATNGRSVSISSAAAAITQTTGTMSCAGLSMTNGTYTCTGNSILNSSGSVSVTGGTFSEGTSTLTMSGASTTIRFAQSPLLQPHDLTISAAAPGVSITGENLTVGNNLSVSSGGVFATNNFSLTVNVGLSCSGTLDGSASPAAISVTGDTTASGRINLNGGNFSTTNLTVSGVPGLVASASETITVGGNIDFSNAGDNFTQATSLIVMTGASDPATINATGEDFFNDLQINKTTGAQRVQLLTNLFLANGAGDLTMSRGTLQLNGFTLRLGTNLSMSSATAATIAIGTGTLDGATNGRSVSISSAAAAITQGTGTLSTPALSVSAGAYTITGTATVSIGAGGLSQTGGTFTADAAAITSSGSVSVTAGTFTEGSSTLTMDTAGTTIHFTPSPLHQPHNLIITAGGAGVTIASEALNVGGDITIATGGIFGTNTFSLAVTGNADVSGTLTGSASPAAISVTGDTTASGTINLNNGDFSTNNLTVSGVAPANGLVASGAEIITVKENLDLSAVGTNYTPASSTITMGDGTLNGTINCPPTEETFYELEISKGVLARIVSLQTDIIITHSLTIISGTLSAGTHTITMRGVTWDNQGSKTGLGTFNPGTGTVFFTTTSAITISGSNSWYNFNCTTDGKAFTFENLQTQTILSGGNLTLLASGPTARITLTSDLQDPTVNPSYPPTPPQYAGQWYITITVGASASIDFVNVSYSFATITITPGPGCVDGLHNTNWQFFIPIVASWTLDTNNDGRIDRIRVQVQVGTQLSDDFTGLDVTIVGNAYEVSGYGTAAGPVVGAGDDVFDILLDEGTHEDTSALPQWTLNSNSTLYGKVGGALVEYGTKVYAPNDGSRPVITYTLAAVGSTRAYVHFSETVFGNAAQTAPIGTGSLVYSDGTNSITAVTPVERDATGIGAHAAVITFTSPLTVANVLPSSAQTFSVATGAIWGVPAAVDPGTVVPAPFPNNTNLDNNLPPNAVRSMLNGSTTPSALAHLVSDVGLNLVEPVYAYDTTILRDPVRGGIGKVTTFDGSQWLRPRDTQLEARIMATAPVSTDALGLWWDVNPQDPILLNGLWIPPSASTLFPHPPGTPQPAPALPDGTDRFHNPNTAARTTAQPPAVNGALRDFLIPGNDPEFTSGARLQFLFLINDGGHLFPCARLADPNDPTSARPFEYQLNELQGQRANVTITNNVINPANHEVAHLTYVMSKPGKVTITVFDLKGDIVDVLFSGTQTAGEHTTGWDGKNRGGRIVARGIYFIRAVGPGFDEFRKVLVVR